MMGPHEPTCLLLYVLLESAEVKSSNNVWVQIIMLYVLQGNRDGGVDNPIFSPAILSAFDVFYLVRSVGFRSVCGESLGNI